MPTDGGPTSSSAWGTRPASMAWTAADRGRLADGAEAVHEVGSGGSSGPGVGRLRRVVRRFGAAAGAVSAAAASTGAAAASAVAVDAVEAAGLRVVVRRLGAGASATSRCGGRLGDGRCCRRLARRPPLRSGLGDRLGDRLRPPRPAPSAGAFRVVVRRFGAAGAAASTVAASGAAASPADDASAGAAVLRVLRRRDGVAAGVPASAASALPALAGVAWAGAAVAGRDRCICASRSSSSSGGTSLHSWPPAGRGARSGRSDRPPRDGLRAHRSGRPLPPDRLLAATGRLGVPAGADVPRDPP